MSRFRIGIDIGGTFTDLVALDEATGELSNLKVPSTTERLAGGVVEAFKEFLALMKPRQIDVVLHATTIATNAILGQMGLKLPKAALITTRGFRDILEIGRQNRPELYNLFVKKPEPLIPRRYRYEVDERVDSLGRETTPLSLEGLRATAAVLRRERVDSVAVALLNSHVNPEHEEQAKMALQRELPGVFITGSCDVSPEYREYERVSTSVVNALLMPLVATYVAELAREIDRLSGSVPFYVMKSNGGVASQAATLNAPVTIIESGPTAGVTASAFYGRLLGISNVLSFDMGGTSAKAGLIREGNPEVVTEYEVGGKAHRGRMVKGTGYPVRLPFVDLAECSAGGGTIAWVDQGRGLRVGPLSTGAHPGPACYGTGGEEPTVADANLLLGRLSPHCLLGGKMRIYKKLARNAVAERICRKTGLSVTEAAMGIVRIVNSQMAKILRMVSVERGFDPRTFTLIAFGGAGPLHACALAEDLDISSVIVPINPGLFSAYGLLAADLKYDFAKAIMGDATEADPGTVEKAFRELESEGRMCLAKEKVENRKVVLTRGVDARYAGQAYELTIPVGRPFTRASLRKLVNDFGRKHRAVYGYAADDETIEIVNVRLSALGLMNKPNLKKRRRSSSRPAKESITMARDCYFERYGRKMDTPIYARQRLQSGNVMGGPAIVEQYDATTVVYPGWQTRIDEFGNIRMERK